MEELINRFLIKANYDKKKIDDLLFLFNAKRINPQEKKSIKNYGLMYGSVIHVEFKNAILYKSNK